jgi:cephalosporin hydroxylase
MIRTHGEHEDYYTLGKAKYNGVFCCHCPAEFDVLMDLVWACKPDRIMEFGTGPGVLTMRLGSYAGAHNAMVLSNDLYDHLDLKVRMSISDLPVMLLKANEFKAQETAPIAEFLDDGSRLFVYCDGGHKPQEMRQILNFLKSGDVLACHDFERTEKEDEGMSINKESERVYEKQVASLLSDGFERLIHPDEHKKGMHVFACRKV